MPINTNTMIATCVQIHTGDIAPTAYRRRSRALALALTICLGACATLAAAGAWAHGGGGGRAHAAAATLLGGLNITGLEDGSTPADADRAIAPARELHASIVRVQIPWTVFEPRAAGAIDPRAQAFTDRLVADAAAAGIRPILTVDTTPCWATTAPASLARRCTPGREGPANAWPPRDMGEYAAFVGYLARRYGTRLAAIEIWNEPDQVNERYLAGPSKPQRYAELLRAAYPAIKQADPQLQVLAGSLVGSNGVFLRALYAAGIKGYYDGLAVHYYHLTLASLRSIREVQLANGDSKPLWLDEFGWPSCWPRRRIEQEQACVTPQVQAANVRTVVRSLARASYVAAYAVYGSHDSATEDFGVLSRSGARKPSFAALKSVLANPFGPVGRVTLSLRRHGGRVIASGSAPVGDFMQLEVFQGTVLRYRALFTLDRFNRYSLALPAALGTSGLRVRVFQYWQGRGKDAQRSI